MGKEGNVEEEKGKGYERIQRIRVEEKGEARRKKRR